MKHNNRKRTKGVDEIDTAGKVMLTHTEITLKLTCYFDQRERRYINRS